MSFQSIYPYVAQFEGGYVNDPADSGGETFRGISRVNWPRWPGWAAIDAAKKQGIRKARDIDVFFKNDEAMQRSVEDFYETNFYRTCADLGLPDRATGKMFDTAVNCGTGRAVKFAQAILGVAQDGVAGPKTRAAAAAYFKAAGDEGKFLKAFVAQQSAFYQGIVARKPSQAKFLNGWLRRAQWVPA
jgi:lysozyme family protein